MKFLAAFPNLVLNEKYTGELENAEVIKVARAANNTLLNVYAQGKEEILRDDIRKIEIELEKLFLGLIRVEIIYSYDMPAPQKNSAAVKNEKSDSAAPRKKYPRKAKATEEGMLYGKQFEGECTQISDIVSEMKEVIVRGEIFDSETKETKSGAKILKISLTDYKDSISAKIFLSDKEEELIDLLAAGLTVSVCGKAEYDNYDGELEITRVFGIRETESIQEVRTDNEKAKRVELHLHTQFSEMDAITDVKALIKKAASWGHKAVAITDHGIVQGFTPALHVLEDLKKDRKKQGKELDFKLIYGVEGYLVDDTEFPICDPADGTDVECSLPSAIPDEHPKEPDPVAEAKIAAVKKAKTHHIIILVQNETGRVNLYRLISLAHINFFNKRPRIPKSVLMKYREGLIIGSACVMGELADAILYEKTDEELDKIAAFYDYLEIQPLGNNQFLLRNYMKNAKGHKVRDIEGLRDINRKILSIGDRLGKRTVATGDVHFLNPEDEIYRRIIEDSQHYEDADEQAPLYFRTTEEMLAEFDYLGEERAREVVVDNTNFIADQIESISPVRPDKCPPVIPDSDQRLRDICYGTAHDMYGDPLPAIVQERLDKELNSIISNGYSVMYIIAHELIKKSVNDGYLVGSRGSVGSSFAATMAKITEVNPLKPHYRCPYCRLSDIDSDEVGKYDGNCGFDMPDRLCPVCGGPLVKDGIDIPFETFLGFKGDKEPDIDLNFSGDYQSKAHSYTEVLFGKGHTFRAGTISTLQENTVFGFVKGYYERHNLPVRKCEMTRLVKGCMGVKRSTGQHPGGIVVLPHGEEIYSFTPIQYPANSEEKGTVTTHFEYHSIDHNLLKLDILGHDDPTMVRMLEDLTGLDLTAVPLDDKKVMSLFKAPEALGITSEDIGGKPAGTLGIPEFGTDFVMQMLVATQPETFSDLVRISGLSHGTDVWTSNAEELVKSGTATLSSCICTRDDIMLYLIKKNLEPSLAFEIMEKVRKGKGLTPEYEQAMNGNDVPGWYIDSCKKIKYMFPKAHAAAYVIMALRIAYCKVYHPLAYYAAFFSIRASSFDYERMCLGKEKLIENMNIIRQKIEMKEASQKEQDLLKYMYNVLEFYARGFEFLPIDIYEAKAEKFRIIDGRLMPSFDSIDGVGGKAAAQLEEAAAKEPFTSREDLKIRARISGTVADKLYSLGICGRLPETAQLSLFDLLN